MIQRFILLGEGYSDLYELLEIARSNQSRIHMLLRLDTTINSQQKCSLIVILKPADPGKLMPLYLSLEGIYHPDVKDTVRYRLFNELATELNLPIHQLEVKNSTQFEELELFYQYLIGVLRLNKYLPPLQ